MDWLTRRPPVPQPTAMPQLAIGAGHGTHLSLLAARRACNCMAVVLMKPGWPVNWFDLCFIPRHDGVKESDHVVTTLGALTPVQYSQDKTINSGMILIGGPSKHYAWQDDAILEQITRITTDGPNVHWQIATSRRTPATLVDELSRLENDQIRLVLHNDCPAGWLDSELPRQEQVWVSPDSVSMVYEAITAGARVGLLDLPTHKPDRIARSMASLAKQGMVTSYQQWDSGQPLTLPAEPLNEARRCAAILQEKLLGIVTT